MYIMHTSFYVLVDMQTKNNLAIGVGSSIGVLIFGALVYLILLIRARNTKDGFIDNNPGNTRPNVYTDFSETKNDGQNLMDEISTELKDRISYLLSNSKREITTVSVIR